MSDTIFMANQIFHHTFPVGSHKSALFITVLSQTCNEAKPCMSVIGTFAVTTNHLVG